jgi:transglutaminase-like putative cysteine protease
MPLTASWRPAGDFSIREHGTIEDDGTPDPVVWDAPEIPVTELPNDCLVYLLGSRYCETDRLSQIAWDMFEHVSPGWGRVQAICNFVNQHIVFGYDNARATRTAFESHREGVGHMPRLRPPCHRALPLHEHPGALR